MQGFLRNSAMFQFNNVTTEWLSKQLEVQLSKFNNLTTEWQFKQSEVQHAGGDVTVSRFVIQLTMPTCNISYPLYFILYTFHTNRSFSSSICLFTAVRCSILITTQTFPSNPIHPTTNSTKVLHPSVDCLFLDRCKYFLQI